MFGDFQSLKSNPDEHRIQPIEASQLEGSDHQACSGRAGRLTCDVALIGWIEHLLALIGPYP